MRFPVVCLIVAAAAACDEVAFPTPEPQEEFQATLSGANESPPVTTAASGSVIFAVTLDTFLAFRLDGASIDSTTAAHIHEGDASVASGPILVTLFTGASACQQNAGAALTITSSSVGNPTTITTATPHGLIVGSTPLMRIAGHAGSTPDLNGHYTAKVTGASTFTVPVNVTTAGTGGTVQRFTLINVASPRCRPDFTGQFSQGQFRPSTLPNDTLTHRHFTTYGVTPRERFDSLLASMRAGAVYVNVHTQLNPAGEVRGQVQLVP